MASHSLTANAIKAINSSARFALPNDDIDLVVWLEDTALIPKADVEAKIVELQAEYDNKQYQRDRAKEYPTWQHQLDDIYHNGIDGWKTTIKVTKDKYSKG